MDFGCRSQTDFQTLHKPWVQCPLNVPHNPHPVLPKLLLQKANLAQSHPMLPSDSAAHLDGVVQTVGGHPGAKIGQIDAGDILTSRACLAILSATSWHASLS